MTWFAIYEQATGRLESVGQVVADDATLTAKGLAKLELAFDPRVPTKRWNEGTQDFDDVALPAAVLQLRDFLARFTPAEREDISDAARNHANASARKRLQAFMDYLASIDRVDLGDQYIIDVVTAMENVGLIGAGRAAEILNG